MVVRLGVIGGGNMGAALVGGLLSNRWAPSDLAVVEVLEADWSTLLDRGPYTLLFLDSGEPSAVGVDAVADLVEDGGIVVLDDVDPCSTWPPISRGRVDILRERWLTDERFTAVEVMVAPDAAVVIATKR